MVGIIVVSMLACLAKFIYDVFVSGAFRRKA